MKTETLLTVGGIAIVAYFVSRIGKSNPENVATRQENQTERVVTRQENLTDRLNIRQDERTNRVDIRQDKHTDRVELRQDGKTDRTELRQDGRTERVEAVVRLFKKDTVPKNLINLKKARNQGINTSTTAFRDLNQTAQRSILNLRSGTQKKPVLTKAKNIASGALNKVRNLFRRK